MIRIVYGLAALIFLSVMPASAASSVYDHDSHVQVEDTKACNSCHEAKATSIKPERELCLECHDDAFLKEVIYLDLKTHHGPVWSFNHGTYVRTANKYDCSICHEQDWCLDCHAVGSADEMGRFSNSMVNVHRSDFHISHPIAARTNPQLCATCHERKFCNDCHDDFAPEDLSILSHRKGWSNRTTIPGGGVAHSNFNVNQCQTCHINSVLPSQEWSRSHAREARKNLATCQACHPEGDICLKCHSAVSGLGVNPHPKDWNNMDNRLRNSSDQRTCRKCH